MRKISLLFLVTLCLCASNTAFSQTTQKAPAKQPAQTKTSTPTQGTQKAPVKQPAKTSATKKTTPSSNMSQASIDSIRMVNTSPGQMHQMLSQSIGQWSEEIIVFEESGTEKYRISGDCYSQMILGDRFLEMRHNGNMKEISFECISTIGYDNSRNIFLCTWFDNFHTGIINLEGKWSEESKTINFFGKQSDPVSGREKPINATMVFVEDGSQTIDVFSKEEGKEESKTMTVTLRRR